MPWLTKWTSKMKKMENKSPAIRWYKRWSTQLAGINVGAVVTFYMMIPDRMLDAIPAAVHGLLGVSLLAAGLIPVATSAKQKKPE